MKTMIRSLTVGFSLVASLSAQAEIRDYSDFFGSGVGGNTTTTSNSSRTFEFVKNGQRLCKAGGGFFSIKCSDRSVGERADAINTQIADYCDAMIVGDTVIYRLKDFYSSAQGTQYLAIRNGQSCQFIGKNTRPVVPVRPTAILTREDLQKVSIYGQNSEAQPAQIVVKTGGEARWVTIYKSQEGIPVVELRNARNVKVVDDRYLLAKGNGKAYDGIVGFRTQSCSKMAAENHDVNEQIKEKNLDESCLQIVGRNEYGEYVSLSIIPTSKLKNHLFRSVEKGWTTYTVEREYSDADFLLDLLGTLFGN
jgi:hypothetical protein